MSALSIQDALAEAEQGWKINFLAAWAENLST
jgi:hypothetical protein